MSKDSRQDSTSMKIIKKINAENDRVKVFQTDYKRQFWGPYPVGKEFYIAGDSWYRRTEEGIDKIEKPTTSYIIPMFCPECKKPLKTPDDNKAYMREGHCFLCHIHSVTERNKKS